jgi:receptor protein-tyrosine kinase
MDINSNPSADDTSASGENRSIGEILVGLGKLSPLDVEKIQRLAVEKSIRFGEAAVQLGLLTPDELDLALARQFRFPVLSVGDEGFAKAVVAAYDPLNHVVDQMRALRSQLMFHWLNDAERKVLAITSPGRGEGRSWLAANLAVALAQIGKRTLLIDADMRNPFQHRLFNIENTSGLSSLLTGRGAPSGFVRVHPALRLHVVPAGSVPPNPEELLARPLFGTLLDGLAAKFEVVLLDTPPAMPTSDAQLVAAKAGNALMLARGDYTRRANLVSAMAALKQAKVNVVGSVVNSYSGNGLFTR